MTGPSGHLVAMAAALVDRCRISPQMEDRRPTFLKGKGDVPGRLPFRRKVCQECAGTSHVTPMRREQIWRSVATANSPPAILLSIVVALNPTIPGCVAVPVVIALG